MDGGLSTKPATSSVNSSTTGSIMTEWKAREAFSRRVATPSAARSASTAAMASGSPDSTHRSGPLTAARESRSPSSGRTRDSGSGTASIAPGASRPISSARAATSVSASSRVSTPDRQAATYSPRL